MRPLAFLLSVSIVLGAGCGPKEPPTPELTPEEALAARETIVDWLECDECRDGQLAAAVELGEVAVPVLAAALEAGPSPASVELLRYRLGETWDTQSRYAETHPEAKLASGRDEYIQGYVDNFTAQYQVRAATALGRIGTPSARSALEAQSRQTAARTDVQEAVRTALGSQ